MVDENKDLARQSPLNLIATTLLSDFPYDIILKDSSGHLLKLGQGKAHWAQKPLIVHFKSPQSLRAIQKKNILKCLELFLDGQIDFSGNLYLLSDIQHMYMRTPLSLWQRLYLGITHNTFQNFKHAKKNVKSHYDIPQDVLDIYLDQKYQSYSCGMFEAPESLNLQELVQKGQGKQDGFDSLEKAQWRKFKDAVDFIAPKSNETLLDIGCGYAGQLEIALEEHPFGKVVGWTLSANQVHEGQKRMARFSTSLWELHEGDYREEKRVFDHITSTGMISHIGPRGLTPYIQAVRQRIKTKGRYVHHAIMRCYSPQSLNAYPGVAFNKQYVWPGFHWFTLGEHVKALEENGFQVVKCLNLSPHYAKTTACWYERLYDGKDELIPLMGEPTFKAWQIYLAGACGGFLNQHLHVYRLYCEAI